MNSFSGLPDRRSSLTGHTDDGDEIWIIRSISQKLYTCQGCYDSIQVGDEHVVIQYIGRISGTEHAHWHRRCARGDSTVWLLRDLGSEPRCGPRITNSDRAAGGNPGRVRGPGSRTS